MAELKSRHLFDIDIEIDPPQQIGATPFGLRRIVTLAGGWFSGERLRGVVPPGVGILSPHRDVLQDRLRRLRLAQPHRHRGDG
jgi:hypothetical protein